MSDSVTAEDSDGLVESFFRLQSANLVSVLTRAFGFPLIDTVEDMVQEAMLEAVRNWRIHGVPQNPAAWLHRVARNRVIDALRRQRGTTLESPEAVPDVEPKRISFADEAIQDSLLAMMFACCHPGLNRKSQLALTLKVLCGLGDREIARGLMITPAAAKRRVTRAKRYLQLNRIDLTTPPQDLDARLSTVHDVLYLLFNEGYSATCGQQPLRIDLCEEATRLCHLLCQSPLAQASTRALLALMVFHAARFDARVDGVGAPVLLEDQDRERWDQALIKVGERWLARSYGGPSISRYHLEAGISHLHCRAPSVEATDWATIVGLYDRLLELQPSPFYRLNRAIAVARTGEVQEALDQLQDKTLARELDDYPFYHCAIATLLEAQGEPSPAITCWQRALELTHTPHDQHWISGKLAQCQRDSLR